jgi:ferredoxin-type protein NapF
MRRGISRRNLLRGDLTGISSPVRPPWALTEFTHLCDHCGDCSRVCPEGILVRGADGLPNVDFARGGCSFCGECVKVCRPGALAFADDSAQPPWPLTAVIADGCLSAQGVVCRSCGESCPEGAIRFRLRLGGRAAPLVDADLCSGCGGCFRVCPVGAISLQARSAQAGV